MHRLLQIVHDVCIYKTKDARVLGWNTKQKCHIWNGYRVIGSYVCVSIGVEQDYKILIQSAFLAGYENCCLV